MNKKKISVLISYPDHFVVMEIAPALEIFQKIVGGLIEIVPRPTAESGWFAYCNENHQFEGAPANYGANNFLDKLYLSEGFAPFTARDTMHGNVLFFSTLVTDESREASLPVEYVQRYMAAHLESAWLRASVEPVITVIRDDKDIWVFDQHRGALIPQHVASVVRKARGRDEHGMIEVWSSITPTKWVELRVELMDDVTGITLHDEREDRTYG